MKKNKKNKNTNKNKDEQQIKKNPETEILEEKSEAVDDLIDSDEDEEEEEVTATVFGIAVKDQEAQTAYEAYLLRMAAQKETAVTAQSTDAENGDAVITDSEITVSESADAESTDTENTDTENTDTENTDTENPDIENTDTENTDLQTVVTDITDELPSEDEFEEIDLEVGDEDKSGIRRLLIALIGLGLLLAVVIYGVCHVTKKNNSEATQSQTIATTQAPVETLAPTTVIATETTTPTASSDQAQTENTEDHPEDTEAYSIVYELNEGAYPELEEVIRKYYQYTAECDLLGLQSLYYDPTNVPVTSDILKRKSAIIEEYKEITCYSADGLAPDEVIVYVYYELKFKEIKTTAPTLIRFYMKQLEDKSWKIYNGTIGEELTNHLDKMTANREVISLMVQVNRAFSQACEKDEDLNRLISLMGVTRPAQEESTTN